MTHATPPGNVPLRVAVRVRPRLRRDARNGTDTIAADECRVVVGGNDAFTFSQAFGPEATQRAVYNYCAAPQVAAVLDGLDACVFAFGQTGAGKTFSMLGPEGGRSSTQDGLVPLAAAEIFCAVARLEAEDQRCQHRRDVRAVEVVATWHHHHHIGGGGRAGYEIRRSMSAQSGIGVGAVGLGRRCGAPR